MSMKAKESDNEQTKHSRNWSKHAAWIVIWWLSLGFVIQHNSGTMGLAFLTVFFLVSTWKKLGKIVILAIIVGILCALMPFLETVAVVVGIIGMILKGRFLIRNWRPLLVGLYAYGVYGFILIMTKTIGLITYLASSRTAEAFASSGQLDASVPLYIQLLPYIFTGMLAFLLHRMVLWLYRHDYDTDTAFGIMGITPLIVVGFVMPFLKGLDTDFDIDLSDLSADDIDTDAVDDLLPDTSELDVDTGIDADASDTDDLSIRDVVNTSKSVSQTLVDNFGDELPEGFDNVDTFLTDLQSMQNTGNTILSSIQNLQDAQSLGDAFWSSINSIPAPVQAAMAVAAAAASFKMDEDEMVFRISGLGKLKAKRIDDTHAVLLGAENCQLGEITFNEQDNCERIKLNNGIAYIINYKTGRILDSFGHTLGYIQKDSTGALSLTNKDQQSLGTYLPNGRFFNPLHQMTARLETA